MPRPSKVFRNSDSQVWENNMYQGCSHNFVYCLKYFGDKYGVRGSRFGNNFGRSKNVPESIAIDQEPLINHFGINKVPQKTIIIFKNKEQSNTRFLFCRILGLVRPRFLDSKERIPQRVPRKVPGDILTIVGSSKDHGIPTPWDPKENYRKT